MRPREKWVTISFDLFAVGRAIGLAAGIAALAILLYAPFSCRLSAANTLWDAAAAAVFSLFFILTNSFCGRLRNSLPLRIGCGAAYAGYAVTLTAVSSAWYLMVHLPIVHIHWIGKTYNVMLPAVSLLLWAALLLTLFSKMPDVTKGTRLALLSAMLFSVRRMTVWCGSTIRPSAFLTMAVDFLLPVLAAAIVLMIWMAAFTIGRENRNHEENK